MSSPLPTSGTTYVDVSALLTGKLYLPDRWLFEDGDEDMLSVRQFSPDFSFLIGHPSGKRALFDLGLRKDLENNPTAIQNDYCRIAPVVPKDATDLLQAGPVSASAINTVIFSHLHFDHTGDCTKFPDADVIVGPGSRAATTPGYPHAAGSPFSGAVLEHPRFRELSFEKDSWVPLGPFLRAHDFFGDNSFYLIDAPGHMPGHLGGLALTGKDEWVFMGGDCCHHRSLLDGKRPMSVTVGPGGTTSFHKDPPTAMRTIEKIRLLEAQGDVLVALAHDAGLEGKMPEYPATLNKWKGSSWKHDHDAMLAKVYS